LAHSGAFLESVCNNTTNAVYYHNKSDRSVIVPKGIAIGVLSDLEELECHLLDARTAEKITCSEPFAAAERHADFNDFDLPSAVTGFHLSADAFVGIGDRVPKAMEELLADAMGESLLDDIGPPDISSSIDDIKIAPDLTEKQKRTIRELVIRHRAIWEKTDGVVIEPPENWMKIKLKPGARIKSQGVYRLRSRDRKVVDEMFDKLRSEGKMSRCEGSPAGWGVFVVRNRNNPDDKGRVVVDTRGLNMATKDDAYPLPR
jgi:hypothetical protein